MKKSIYTIFLWIVLSSNLAFASQVIDTIFDRYTDTTYAFGADISWLPQQEAWGTVYKDDNGTPKDLMVILKEHGVNALRFRVWYPNNGASGKNEVVNVAKRANDMGFKVMIDFHYSDSWADPGKQKKPAAWKNHNIDQLVDDVYDHTQDVLSALKAEGVTPAWVQIGNETKRGMLWPEGSTDTSMKNFARLIKSGYDAIKDIDSTIQAIVHLPDADENNLYRWMFDGLKNNGAKWDIIGMSAYPHWAHLDWEAEIDMAVANMKDMIVRYDTKVMVVEAGHYWYEPYISNNFLVELMDTMMTFGGLGCFFWEPEAMMGYELTAWDPNTHQPTIAMDAFLGIKYTNPADLIQVNLENPVVGTIFDLDQTINLEATATHEDGTIEKVTFYVNNNKVSELVNEPFIYEMPNPGTGTYTIYASAIDNNGLVINSEEVTIQVGSFSTIQEEASGYCGITNNKGSIDSNHENYTGNGFINSDNEKECAINWTVNFLEKGSYSLQFRYAATSNRPGKLIVNGDLIGTLPFNSTESWNEWNISSMNVTLENAGDIPITLISKADDGLPNIDYLSIISLDNNIKAEASSNCLDQPNEASTLKIKNNNKFNIFTISSQNIAIVSSNENINNILIYGVDGKVVKSVENINSNKVEISFNDLTSGLYIIHATAGKNSFIRKYNLQK